MNKIKYLGINFNKKYAKPMGGIKVVATKWKDTHCSWKKHPIS